MKKANDKRIPNAENEIIGIIEKMSGKYTPYIIFKDLWR